MILSRYTDAQVCQTKCYSRKQLSFCLALQDGKISCNDPQNGGNTTLSQWILSPKRCPLLSGGRVETPTFSNPSFQVLKNCLVNKKKKRKLSSSMILRLVELSKPTRSEPYFRVTTEKVRKHISPKCLFSLLFPVLNKRTNHPLKVITRMGN